MHCLQDWRRTSRNTSDCRFEKGYGIDYIGRRLYISRATVFRMQDRILEKLRQAEIETP